MSDRLTETLARRTREHAMNSDAAAEGRREAMLDAEQMRRTSEVYETFGERIEKRRERRDELAHKLSTLYLIPGAYLPPDVKNQHEFCTAYVERAEALLAK